MYAQFACNIYQVHLNTDLWKPTTVLLRDSGIKHFLELFLFCSIFNICSAVLCVVTFYWKNCVLLIAWTWIWDYLYLVLYAISAHIHLELNVRDSDCKYNNFIFIVVFFIYFFKTFYLLLLINNYNWNNFVSNQWKQGLALLMLLWEELPRGQKFSQKVVMRKSFDRLLRIHLKRNSRRHMHATCPHQLVQWWELCIYQRLNLPFAVIILFHTKWARRLNGACTR